MSIIKDVFFGGAEKKAAEAGLEATREGIAEQRRQFDITQENFEPVLEAGNIARERELEFLGLRGPEAEQRALDNFSESPGQAFLRQRQERALLRNASAIGGLGGGNVRTALQEQAAGIASTQLAERKNRLAQVSGSGAAGVANLGALGANAANQISSLSALGGQIAGEGITGRASGIRGGLARIAGVFS